MGKALGLSLDCVDRLAKAGDWWEKDVIKEERVRELGQIQELRMARGCDPQQVLSALISRTRVNSFSVTKPSLHDIFVRIAGSEAGEEEQIA